MHPYAWPSDQFIAVYLIVACLEVMQKNFRSLVDASVTHERMLATQVHGQRGLE